MVEWASWWDKTIKRWEGEGLPAGLNQWELFNYFGLDKFRQRWVSPRRRACPDLSGIILDGKNYDELKEYLYPYDYIPAVIDEIKAENEAYDKGEFAFWYTIEGFFWFPRTLFGIERHLFAFYDCPKLYHRICRDLTDFNKALIEGINSVSSPEFMTFAEDMSYNLGPMLSKDFFYEFIAPYYRELIPSIKKAGTKVFVDTDGDVTSMLPWLQSAGVEGVLPLERQAGVDINKIKFEHPALLMLGGFDKTVMHKGDKAIRAEFERLRPAVSAGGYIMSVDHQTPPEVSLEDYRLYLEIYKEYACLI